MKSFNKYIMTQDVINNWGAMLSFLTAFVNGILALTGVLVFTTIPWWVTLGVPVALLGVFIIRDSTLTGKGSSEWFHFHKSYNCDRLIEEAKLGLNILNNQQVIMIKVKNTWWYVGQENINSWFNQRDDKKNNKAVVEAINNTTQYKRDRQDIVPYSDDLEIEIKKLEGGKE